MLTNYNQWNHIWLKTTKTLQSADLRWLGGQQINHKIYLEFKKKNDLFGYITRCKEKFNIF